MSFDSLGIKFNNPKLLEQAFTHRSYLNETKESLESNERLEFLGDSILSFVITSYIYKLRPKDAEGDLTNLRSYIVKTKSLAEAAQNLGLGEMLKLDAGIEAAKKLIDETLLPNFQKELQMGPPKDAKSNLQEITQEKTKQSPQYKILETRGPDHAKQFVIGVFINGKEMGKGEGFSKQEAEEIAATQALEKLS